MKITSVKIYLTRLGGRHPIFAEVHTDENITGTGEAAIAYGVGMTAAAGMIKDLAARFLLHRDPELIEAFLSDVVDFAFWAKNGGPIFWSGVSALEEALWDIKGKALGKPVYDFLGGKCREKVRVYANGWSLDANTPEEFAQQAETAADDGYTALKIYPLAIPIPNSRLNLFDIPGQRTIDRELEDLAVARVRAVRNAIGKNTDILVDLSCALTPDAVIHLGQRLEEYDIFWLEEPADPNDLSGLEKITSHLQIPIALGERLSTRYQVVPLLAKGSIDILQPDVGNTGGILETRKIAAMVEAFGIRVAPHNCASPLATAAALQVDACTPNILIQEVFPYLLPETYAVVDRAPEKEIRDGYLEIPECPGLSIEMNTNWLSKFLWAEVS